MKKSIVKLFFMSFLVCLSAPLLHSTQLQVVKPTEDIKSLFDKGLYQEVVEHMQVSHAAFRPTIWLM